jgi:hypothetical protein
MREMKLIAALLASAVSAQQSAPTQDNTVAAKARRILQSVG